MPRFIAFLALLALGPLATAQGTRDDYERANSVFKWTAGKVTSEAITAAYIARIKTEDKKINSVLALNPKALEEAKAADQRRAATFSPAKCTIASRPSSGVASNSREVGRGILTTS